MPLLSAGRTDIGKKRSENQDSILINKERNIFLVADGTGGHRGGDMASNMAVQIFERQMITTKESAANALVYACKHANASIYAKAQSNPQLKGMGTTMVGCFFREDTAYFCNVGDSRAYLLNGQNLFQLTKDHSLVQEKLNLGIYSRVEAAQDPQRNVIVRTIGYDPDVTVDIYNYKVHRGDIFLLCSDGLHGRISDEDLVYLLNKNIPNPKNATQEQLERTVELLIQQANSNGGNDNISVILILAQ